jgi:hypothetical protein
MAEQRGGVKESARKHCSALIFFRPFLYQDKKGQEKILKYILMVLMKRHEGFQLSLSLHNRMIILTFLLLVQKKSNKRKMPHEYCPSPRC